MTFLGTGTSQGVPVITCQCAVCSSVNPKDQRLRTSVLMRTDNQTIAIDSGPDFRQQMLRAGVNRLDGLVLTHEHKDHIAGLDDIRAFNFSSGLDMPVYSTAKVQEALRREFHYVFAATSYPGVPRVGLHEINDQPFYIGDDLWTPLPVRHHQLPVLGFRLGSVAYITDANHLEHETWDRLQGVEVLVLNALRKEAHVSHFTLEEALEIAEKVGARETYLTHISHQLGVHDVVQAELPAGVFLAYDGLVVHTQDEGS
jgi:phosphoribosyl 1,2-cyclic phosphate phosphodiesterase